MEYVSFILQNNLYSFLCFRLIQISTSLVSSNLKLSVDSGAVTMIIPVFGLAFTCDREFTHQSGHGYPTSWHWCRKPLVRLWLKGFRTKPVCGTFFSVYWKGSVRNHGYGTFFINIVKWFRTKPLVRNLYSTYSKKVLHETFFLQNLKKVPKLYPRKDPFLVP
jgi:hypothetical protein